MLPPGPANHELGATVDAELLASLDARPAPVGPPCPVDRLPRRVRNKICIGIIALGLLNYLAYTLTYAALGGDAHNGYRAWVEAEDGTRVLDYYVKGHFIHSLSGREQAVSRGAWIYSYVHSITVPLTSGAMLISMLILARPHILATMRGRLIGGQTFVVAFGTIVILATVAFTTFFTWDFVTALSGE